MKAGIILAAALIGITGSAYAVGNSVENSRSDAGIKFYDEFYFVPLPAPAMELPVPADRHAVTYKLRGLVTMHPDKTVLNTEDGRVFILEMFKEQCVFFDNRLVEVWGKAEASDDVSTILVSSIELYTPTPAEVELPPHKEKFRPAAFLGERDGALEVGNVRWLEPAAATHDFSWPSVSIRPELIKEIYFVTKVQPPGLAGHSLLFYEFKDGGFVDATGRKSKGFFLSVETYAREGQSYSLLAGFRKTYNILWLLTNFEDYVMYGAGFGENWMNFYPVLNDKAEKENMVRDTVAQATINREGEWYHSTRNNCTNNLVMMINRSLPEARRVKMWAIPSLIYNFFATTPPMVPGYLGKKGVLGPKAFTIGRNNFQEYIPVE